MKNVIVIPARLHSQRVKEKAMCVIGGRRLVQIVWEIACKSELADDVVIAVDNGKVRDYCLDFGANAIMTSPCLASGTDRVACITRAYNSFDVVVNLQVDLPFVNPAVLDLLFLAMRGNKKIDIATLCNRRSSQDKAYRKDDVVKVTKNSAGQALYFSRSPIPYDIERVGHWFHHFGIYAYRNATLQHFSRLSKGELERAEGLEQLRALEDGMNISVVETDHVAGIEINTERDLENARRKMREST